MTAISLNEPGTNSDTFNIEDSLKARTVGELQPPLTIELDVERNDDTLCPLINEHSMPVSPTVIPVSSLR